MTLYTADQNNGLGIYYVMVNLYRGIFQSHKRSLEAAIHAASSKFRSRPPSILMLDLQAQDLVQQALDLKVRTKWDQSQVGPQLVEDAARAAPGKANSGLSLC